MLRRLGSVWDRVIVLKSANRTSSCTVRPLSWWRRKRAATAFKTPHSGPDVYFVAGPQHEPWVDRRWGQVSGDGLSVRHRDVVYRNTG